MSLPPLAPKTVPPTDSSPPLAPKTVTPTDSSPPVASPKEPFSRRLHSLSIDTGNAALPSASEKKENPYGPVRSFEIQTPSPVPIARHASGTPTQTMQRVHQLALGMSDLSFSTSPHHTFASPQASPRCASGNATPLIHSGNNSGNTSPISQAISHTTAQRPFGFGTDALTTLFPPPTRSGPKDLSNTTTQKKPTYLDAAYFLLVQHPGTNPPANPIRNAGDPNQTTPKGA